MALGTFLASMDGTIVLSSYASIGDELNELQRTRCVMCDRMPKQAAVSAEYRLSAGYRRAIC